MLDAILSTGDSPVPSTTLSIETVADFLRNERRRILLERLREAEVGEELGVGELADYVAAKENGVPVGEAETQDRKTAYVCLYQVHCPRFDEVGVADYGRGAITKTAETDRVIAVYDELNRLTGGER